MRSINYRLGIDIGSTTIKIAVIKNDDNKIIFSDYIRHLADIQGTLKAMLNNLYKEMGDINISPMITGSGGLSLSKNLEIPFIQEVIAVSSAIKEYEPKTNVAIELGGEDAKIIYIENGNTEQRMNGICAGGTGAFIDQMASLINTDADGLNEYAKNYKSIYKIAARCGVFAKTDIQPLINDGVSKEDLSVSILQAVVNQTISGLACGRPITGYVAFLGGPLHFISELKECFIRTLKLDSEHILEPENSHLFAAIGSGFNTDKSINILLSELLDKLNKKINIEFEVERMEPLFLSEDEFDEFISRQNKNAVVEGKLSEYKGNCFLGIDAGSTTTKVALIGEDGSLLYNFYRSNEGNPLLTSIEAVKEIYEKIPATANIVYSCSTGYGEALIKEALMLDEGEVETVAHCYAATFFDPKVDCILDIGGQDMKCIKVKKHVVDNVQLNEACSSGCGSFIETFAKSLSFDVEEFAKEALFAKNPIDLGSRCTVFMNSKVKQAQKEGASVADISAGLAYSIIKNALYKVIKVSDASELGENIVVQGGTFYNDAVLRSFEKLAKCNVTRPNISGIMGAFGAALIAKERYDKNKKTTIISNSNLKSFKYSTSMSACKICSNNCRLTITRFSEKRNFITGNRCERGVGKEKTNNNIPNLYQYKLNKLFSYKPLSKEEAVRGTVGIPRVLNMYENYPFWYKFFTELKYRVVISPKSNRDIYELGIDSIPSESECYPAKISHGHIMWLIKQGVDYIFYPCIPYERKEFKDAVNHYNCPIVTSYPENIKNNIKEIKDKNIRFHSPFIALTSEKILSDGLIKEFDNISEREVRDAVNKAWTELSNFRDDIKKQGEKTLEWMAENNCRGIVLAGRPYHLDPEIHHGIPDMINSYGVAVLTEDSVSHLQNLNRSLVVSNQWMYHSRLYAAANYVSECEKLELIQLNSFGCGLDAVTSDEVKEILEEKDKLYTCLKIDEINNLGAARIRIRSLLAALDIRESSKRFKDEFPIPKEPIMFTKDMRKNYTILCPQMSPIHFSILEAAFKATGYNIEVLKDADKEAINIGLKYVNNDSCYPSLIVVGQIVEAILSGKYDTEKVAIIITQTGGGCRASNYINFIRKALKKINMEHIPVISLNLNGLEKNPGFKITAELAMRLGYGVVFGDILMKCIYRMRPYEKLKGSTNFIHKRWEKICIEFISNKGLSHRRFKEICRDMIREFDNIPIVEMKKPKVGIVGEILVKYHPLANNNLVEILEREGAEVVVPDLFDFINYCLYNQNFKSEFLGGKNSSAFISNLGIKGIEWIRKISKKEFEKSKHFSPSANINEIAEMTKPVISLGNQTGEGWFLTGEMIELIHSDVKNIICTQPFGCLPNHIVGKGVIRELKTRYENVNIVAIDYDPGASEVNQINRIKLMLSNAQLT